MSKLRIFENLKQRHFQFWHITILFVSLIVLQMIISFINKETIRDFLKNTQESYQRSSAEQLANLTTENLELILETINYQDIKTEIYKQRVIHTFNIIFSQQSLQHEINELCFIIKKNKKYYSIDDGRILYNYLFSKDYNLETTGEHDNALTLISGVGNELEGKEEIKTLIDKDGVYSIFVPVVVRGECIGVMYVKMHPDFSAFTERIIASHNETSVIYISLILLGILTMYFVSSYTLKERDEVQNKLMLQHEENIIKEVNYEKEMLFTKRIYHTHHKAEKVMGFIKEDLRQLTSQNIDAVRARITKYSNFISRVIYDMKWYDPPVQTIRNQIFNTDINGTLQFLVDHIFLRIASATETFHITLDLDKDFKRVSVNEFVAWEIFEPLIQNCVDHGDTPSLLITLSTRQDTDTGIRTVTFKDNGKGIEPDLLLLNENGIKKLFLENTSTKRADRTNSGYGCYIAYEMCKKCGWKIDAANLPEGGCIFTITITNG
jgi:hypothetical protein